MRTTDADAYNALVHKTRFEPAEIEAWKRAAEAMYVPYDEKLDIIPRDGGVEAQLLGRAARTKVAADRGAGPLGMTVATAMTANLVILHWKLLIQ